MSSHRTPSPTDGATDEELLAGWAAGDKGSGRALYRRHHSLIVRFFFNKVGDDTADLIQKTFLAVLEGANRFRGDGSFRSWMLGIAYRVMCKHFETLRRNGDPVEDFSVADMGTSPSQMAVRHQEHRFLLDALRGLPLSLQVVLELHYWEGMTNREIAESLGMPMGTVQTRIRRAREKIGQAMEHRADGDTAGGSERDEVDLARWVAQIRTLVEIN